MSLRKPKNNWNFITERLSLPLEMMKSDAAKSAMPGGDTLNVLMDLQKVFSLPKHTHSDMYYSRQLSTSVSMLVIQGIPLCVFGMKANQAAGVAKWLLVCFKL